MPIERQLLALYPDLGRVEDRMGANRILWNVFEEATPFVEVMLCLV